MTRILLLAAIVGFGAFSCSGTTGQKRVIVLGLDGMDYRLVRELMQRGEMPNFSALAKTGGFAPLATSMPPQSPVAWSSFITGMEPDDHGIFDFVHRDASALTPYLSTTKSTPGSFAINVGGFRLPLSSGSVTSMRHGRPFWDVLEERGIETTVIRMPANFPPSDSASLELSGMGTPDVLGTYGTFSYYTSDPYGLVGKTISGGVAVSIDVVGGVARATLGGPENPFRSAPETLSAEFSLHLDPALPFAKLELGNEHRLLAEGGWSDWVPVDFVMAPMQTLRAMARFHLKRVRPYLELYVSPLNIDPMHPALPIASPRKYASELARATGRFYTQGMPEDTKALESGVLTRAEFLEQARITHEENRRQFRHVLSRFERGLLFYYFGNVDQVSHMMWRPRDLQHPAYNASADRPYARVIEDLYIEMDTLVGETIRALNPSDTLVVMSDHGFTSWRRAVHLNSWLRDQGYLTVRGASTNAQTNLFDHVDWSRTTAYALGLNAVYLNVQGREGHGSVPSASRDAMLDELTRKLLAMVDPDTGQRTIARVYRTAARRETVNHAAIAPDLLIGYADGYRTSGTSAEGGLPRLVVEDNTGEWTGDHCIDPQFVPGILLTNRALRKPAPSLTRLTEAIMAEFGIDHFEQDR